MIIITLLTAFCLVSAFITLGLGVYVYTKNPESRVNRLFFAVMLAGTCWAVGEFLIWYPGSYDTMAFWLKASSFWSIAIALLFHFVLALTRHPLAEPEKRWLLFVLVYIPAALITLAGLFTESLYVVAPAADGGYLYHPVPGSLAFLLSTIYITLLMIWSVAICFAAWRRAPPGKIRRQYRLVTACVIILVIFGALAALVVPATGHSVPNLVFIGLVLFSEIITYAILRYDLFTLSPESAVPDIIRLMPDGLILAGIDGRIITANGMAARVLDVPEAGEAGLTGNPVNGYFPQGPCRELRQLLLEKGTVADFEMVLSDPVLRTLSISGTLVRTPEDEPAGFILILRDITERKASEKALAVANEKISLLTQITRHDISNLVTGLDGYLTLLQDQNTMEEDEEYLRSCLRIVERIGSQLRFTREYQNLGRHSPLWQPLGGLIQRARDDISLPGLIFDVNTPVVEIFADPLVAKVFYNIFENAVRHGGHVTAITVSAVIVQNRELLVAIEDNGIGVPDRDKEHIFRYGTGKNTGLGLALSRDVLAVTGIRLIENGIPEKGARFEILVPASGWRQS